MYATLEQLKTYNKQKKYFSKLFRANESTVQKCSDALVEIASANNGVITALAFEAAAQSDTSVLHQIFDWNVTQEVRIATAEQILASIPLLISTNNTLYLLNKNEA